MTTTYDPRTIAFLAELIYPPIQLRAESGQQIHNALYSHAEISYQNFQVAADGIHLTNPVQTPGAVSAVSFTGDRMILREELRGTTLEDFATRLVNVATISFRTLGVPVTLAQQMVVRSLINPRRNQDSTRFLVQDVIGAPDAACAVFGRPMQRAGLAFTFPQTESAPHVFNVRVETWTQDPRSLWLETIGSFTTPITTENVPELSNLAATTYRFLTGPLTEFVGHFDRT